MGDIQKLSSAADALVDLMQSGVDEHVRLGAAQTIVNLVGLRDRRDEDSDAPEPVEEEAEDEQGIEWETGSLEKWHSDLMAGGRPHYLPQSCQTFTFPVAGTGDSAILILPAGWGRYYNAPSALGAALHRWLDAEAGARAEHGARMLNKPFPQPDESP